VNAINTKITNIVQFNSIVDSIESYEVVAAVNHEIQKVNRLGFTPLSSNLFDAFLNKFKLLDSFNKFNLKSPMPCCSPTTSREIIDSGPLRLKDSTKTIDVQSFLFTDMLLLTTIKKDRKGKKRYKVIRPPIPTNRCVVAELKEEKAFVIIQLNAYNVTEAVYMLLTNQFKKWVDKIKEAQVCANLRISFSESVAMVIKISNYIGFLRSRNSEVQGRKQ
jgi:hypothetical protein